MSALDEARRLFLLAVTLEDEVEATRAFVAARRMRRASYVSGDVAAVASDAGDRGEMSHETIAIEKEIEE